MYKIVLTRGMSCTEKLIAVFRTTAMRHSPPFEMITDYFRDDIPLMLWLLDMAYLLCNGGETSLLCSFSLRGLISAR